MYTEDFLVTIRGFGLLGYSLRDIILMVQPANLDQFIKDFNDPENDVYKAYQNGKISGNYALDKSLFDLAKSDSIEANKEFIRRQRERQVNDILRDRFGLDV